MPPLAILHVLPSFAVGGSQARLATLIDCLGDGFEHAICAIDSRFDALEMVGHPERVRRVPPPPDPRSHRAPFYFRRLLRAERPAVLATYNWGAIDALLGGLLGGLPRRPWLPAVHVEDGFGADEALRRKRRRVWTRHFVLSRIFQTVLPSRTLERIAEREYRLAPERRSFIPNGIDTERFRPGRNEELRRQWGAGAGSVVVGFAGRLSAEKNLGLLLRCFAAHAPADARLVLVGDGPCLDSLRAEAAALGLEGRAIFTGAQRDPAPYYQAFDLFAMSSVTEQTPLVLLEAMSSGLPALCTDVGDSAAILDNGSAPVVVASGDAAAYGHSLAAWLNQPELRQQEGRRNRQRAELCYSRGTMVESWRSVYCRAAGVPLPPGS